MLSTYSSPFMLTFGALKHKEAPSPVVDDTSLITTFWANGYLLPPISAEIFYIKQVKSFSLPCTLRLGFARLLTDTEVFLSTVFTQTLSVDGPFGHRVPPAPRCARGPVGVASFDKDAGSLRSHFLL